MEDRRQKAPTFYQPTSSPRLSSPSSGHHSCRPVVPPGNSDEGDDDEDEDEEDEEDIEGAVLKKLEMLSKEQRYMMIGKLYAIKIWAWPSLSWWIGDETEEPPTVQLS